VTLIAFVLGFTCCAVLVSHSLHTKIRNARIERGDSKVETGTNPHITSSGTPAASSRRSL
jgi:hypothetical protein